MGRTRIFREGTQPRTVKLSHEQCRIIDLIAARTATTPASVHRQLVSAGLQALGFDIEEEGVHAPSDWSLAARRALAEREATPWP